VFGGHDEAGNFLIEGIDEFTADTLKRVPGWLESTDPAVRDRLLPTVYQDADEEAAWRRHGVPELEHLFVSRLELVKKDLAGMEAARGATYRLRIPAEHATAWLSALNAARLTIFLLHRLTEADMKARLEDLHDPTKLEPLIRINVLAYLQHLLLH
jgi:uncharacterized protein DUF2017